MIKIIGLNIHPLRMRIVMLLVVCGIAFGFYFPHAPKGKLFIIGGGDRTTEIMTRLVKESGLENGGYAVILPMSSEEPDTSFYYTYIDLVALGCHKVYQLNCTKATANDESIADSIRHATLIYITGGDQSRFMDVVDGSAVLEAIHEAYENGSMIAGTSAGAAVMSKVMITGNSLKNKEYAATFTMIERNNIETRNGLGLIKNAVIDQHFVKRSRHNRLLTAIMEFPGLTGIGIDESTAILVKGKDAEVVGESQVLVFKSPGKPKTGKNDKLAAQGISLNIYLPGDHFKVE